MSISLSELADLLLQRPTVLFLGAGASVPSGAPSGPALAKSLQDSLADGEDISEDLMELATILERRVGREKVVHAITGKLERLAPKGGLLAIPEFAWDSIYTTNFDTLVERSYQRCSRPIVPIRSDFEYARESEPGTKLWKIHGCVSQDRSLGHKGSMLLTEDDYYSFSEYRKALFQRLALDLNTKSVLFVGYSLRDPHVRREAKEALQNRRDGAPGQMYILSYQKDEDRAALWERQGVKVAFGGIDEFMSALTERHARTTPPVIKLGSEEWLLPYTLRANTHCVAEELSGEPNPIRMFNGCPASFADIHAGLTFEREIECQILDAVFRENILVCTIIGVGGVGKTSVARRVLVACQQRGYLAWEHNPDFPFRAADWLLVAETLKTQRKTGVLLVDNSPSFQGHVNTLLEKLDELGDPVHLHVILVGERSAWLPRKKSRVIFSARGRRFILSRLENADIERLVHLARARPEIRRLVASSFSALSTSEQIARLKHRCSADMYVALKHVFGSESLDVIILQEFSQLNEEHRDVYRSVAALEAAGTRVHRQLVMKVLGIESHILSAMLQLLEGIVDEYGISEKDGLYGWRTRHEVIAQTLARFKFAAEDEFVALLRNVVEQLNPSLWLERQTIIDLCNTDFGIRRVLDPNRRVELYRLLVAKAPGERVPRHRLIGQLIRSGSLDEAEVEIRLAIDAVGTDSPIHRYKTVLMIRRAQRTVGLLEEDRKAFLLEAHRLATIGIDRYPEDKYSYFVFSELAEAFIDLDGDPSILDEAIHQLKHGYDRILDPEISEKLRQAIQRRSRIVTA